MNKFFLILIFFSCVSYSQGFPTPGGEAVHDRINYAIMVEQLKKLKEQLEIANKQLKTQQEALKSSISAANDIRNFRQTLQEQYNKAFASVSSFAEMVDLVSNTDQVIYGELYATMREVGCLKGDIERYSELRHIRNLTMHSNSRRKREIFKNPDGTYDIFDTVRKNGSVEGKLGFDNRPRFDYEKYQKEVNRIKNDKCNNLDSDGSHYYRSREELDRSLKSVEDYLYRQFGKKDKNGKLVKGGELKILFDHLKKPMELNEAISVTNHILVEILQANLQMLTIANSFSKFFAVHFGVDDGSFIKMKDGTVKEVKAEKKQDLCKTAKYKKFCEEELWTTGFMPHNKALAKEFLEDYRRQ